NSRRQKQEEQRAEQAQQQKLANASPTERCHMELESFLNSLPDKMPPSDTRSAELWEKLSASVELMSSAGSVDAKAGLRSLITDNRGKKFIISNKKDKEF